MNLHSIGIQTYSGKMFDYVSPTPDMVDILDIAHGLAFCCRYAGQSRFFYSVAEHSLWVSHAVPKEMALVGLLHDATEAYVCDLPRPLKSLLPDYCEIEDRVWEVIAKRFDLPRKIPREVKEIDFRMLATERPVLFAEPIPWPVLDGIVPVDRHIVCAPPTVAFNAFMARFHNLTDGKYAPVGVDEPRIQLLH